MTSSFPKFCEQSYCNLFQDFEFFSAAPLGKAGDVGMFIRRELSPVHVTDMITKSSPKGLYRAEWAEIMCNSVKCFISVYYRHPNTSVSDFLVSLSYLCMCMCLALLTKVVGATYTLEKVKNKKTLSVW